MNTLIDREDLVFSPPQLGCVLCLAGLPGGGSRIYDRSPYGNYGSITGATWKRLPSGLWCLSFDGADDVVTVSDSPIFDVGGGLTISLWFRSDTQQSGRALAIHDESQYKYMLFIETNSTRFLGYLRSASGITELNYTHGGLDDSAWRMGALTFDKTLVSNRAKLFVNAQIVQQGDAYPEDISPGDEGIAVGRIGANYYQGDIALLMVFNRALSALEIQNIFNQQKHLFGVW